MPSDAGCTCSASLLRKPEMPGVTMAVCEKRLNLPLVVFQGAAAACRRGWKHRQRHPQSSSNSSDVVCLPSLPAAASPRDDAHSLLLDRDASSALHSQEGMTRVACAPGSSGSAGLHRSM